MILDFFFPFHVHSSTYIKSITTLKHFISTVLSYLYDTAAPVHQTPIKLHGAVADGERNRRFSYSTTAFSLQDLKWVELQVTQVQGESTNSILSELMKLLRSVISLPLTSEATTQLGEFCCAQINASYGDSTPDPTTNPIECNFAAYDKPLLNLILSDKTQLTKLLLVLSSAHQFPTSYKGRTSSVNVLKDFVTYLRSNCCRPSCFLRPLLTIIEKCHQQQNLLGSEFILDLLRELVLNDQYEGEKVQEDKKQDKKDKDKKENKETKKMELPNKDDKEVTIEKKDDPEMNRQLQDNEMISFITQGLLKVL